MAFEPNVYRDQSVQGSLETRIGLFLSTQDHAYGKTREGVPYSAFFESRRSLGSRRLKCSGFGLQHLWFCYRQISEQWATCQSAFPTTAGSTTRGEAVTERNSF
jgi:hypothetical protein